MGGSTQWKQPPATANLKAIFLVEWQGNIRSLSSKTSVRTTKKKQTQKDTLQILKDPFIMSGCAVNLAE